MTKSLSNEKSIWRVVEKHFVSCNDLPSFLSHVIHRSFFKLSIKIIPRPLQISLRDLTDQLSSGFRLETGESVVTNGLKKLETRSKQGQTALWVINRNRGWLKCGPALRVIGAVTATFKVHKPFISLYSFDWTVFFPYSNFFFFLWKDI